MVEHREVAAVSCDDCAKWWYDSDWNLVKRGGKPLPRPAADPTPCYKCPKIPDGAPKRRESAQELTEENVRALAFHMECRSVRAWPDDRIVRRNAAVIEGIIASVERAQRLKLHYDGIGDIRRSLAEFASVLIKVVRG